MEVARIVAKELYSLSHFTPFPSIRMNIDEHYTYTRVVQTEFHWQKSAGPLR